MTSRTQLLFRYLTEPGSTLRYVIDHPPIGLILAIFLFAQFGDHIARGVTAGTLGSGVFLYLTFGFLLKLALILTLCIVVASFIHFSSELFGTTGSVSSLFLLFLLSFTPLMLRTPAVLLSGKFVVLTMIPIVVWIVALQIKSVQVVYRLSAGKAFLAYAFSLLFMFFGVPLLLAAALIVEILVQLMQVSM